METDEIFYVCCRRPSKSEGFEYRLKEGWPDGEPLGGDGKYWAEHELKGIKIEEGTDRDNCQCEQPEQALNI